MRSNISQRIRVPLFMVIGFFFSVGRALAEGELPDLPPETQSSGCTMLETHAEAILSYWWLVSGLFALAVGIVVHLAKTRKVSRRWRGEKLVWSNFWMVPVIVSTLSYAVACGAFLIYFSRACPIFGNYFQTNVGGSQVATFLFGWLLAIAPAIWCAFRGRGTVQAIEGT